MMNIDDMKFSELKQIAALFNSGQSSNLAASMVGKKVIVRSSNEGINFGEVVEADETGVILKGANRLWRHRPADKSMSWYEGVALSGLTSNSTTSPAVAQKAIIENYSMTICTDEAAKSIMEHTPHAQT